MLNMLNQHAFICERRRSRNLAPLSFPLNNMEPVQTLVGIDEEHPVTHNGIYSVRARRLTFHFSSLVMCFAN